MRLTSRAAVIALIAGAAAVGQQTPRTLPYPIFTTNAWKTAVANQTRTNDGRPGPKYWTHHPSYKITAELDPAEAKVSGHVVMRYTNVSPKPLRSLLIHLRQNLHREGARRIREVEITGGMNVDDVTLNTKKLKSGWRGGYSINGTIMRVRMRPPLKPGADAVVEMDFSFRVPKSGGAPRMGHEDHHVFYLGYWYPQFAVHDDVRGWVADTYLGNGEFYMDYADYDLTFRAPAGFLVRATGTLENPRQVLPSQAIKRLKAARQRREVVHVVTEDDLKAHRVTRRASGKKKLAWHFRANNVRDVAVSVSDRYLWDATHAVVPDRDGPGQDGICMIHAVYESNAKAWRKAAEYARHTIEYNSKTVYPYPWPHMTACEGVSGGGMEYPMMTIISVGPSAQGLHSVIAHELSHMWFPMIVGSNEKQWAWMDEGLTSFLTTFCQQDYWHNDRFVKNEPLGYIRSAGQDWEVAPMRHADRYPEMTPAYGVASYAKTSSVMHQLRYQLGPKLFEEALRTYVRDWAFKHPYPYDLFNTFSRVAKQDLSWYFRMWFFETWTLDARVDSVEKTPNGTDIVIEQAGLAFGPCEVEITTEDGAREMRKIPVSTWLKGARTATIHVDKPVKKVVIDPLRHTLDVRRRNNRWTKGRDGTKRRL